MLQTSWYRWNHVSVPAAARSLFFPVCRNVPACWRKADVSSPVRVCKQTNKIKLITARAEACLQNLMFLWYTCFYNFKCSLDALWSAGNVQMLLHFWLLKCHCWVFYCVCRLSRSCCFMCESKNMFALCKVLEALSKQTQNANSAWDGSPITRGCNLFRKNVANEMHIALHLACQYFKLQ